jgi:hypothetical protein
MAGRDVLLTGSANAGGDGFQLATCAQNLAFASGAIFTITGIVAVRNIVGTVTTVVGTSTSLTLKANATQISAIVDITTITTLTMLMRESATNTALTKIVTGAASLHAAPTDMLMGSAGSLTTINAVLDASGTGVINWALEYFPLAAGAKVVAAQ